MRLTSFALDAMFRSSRFGRPRRGPPWRRKERVIELRSARPSNSAGPAKTPKDSYPGFRLCWVTVELRRPD